MSTPSSAARSISTSCQCWCNSRSSFHCPSLKQGTIDGVIGAQLLYQVLNILGHQIHLWGRLDQVDHAALLLRMGNGQHYTTFRILVVVLGRIGGFWLWLLVGKTTQSRHPRR